MLKKSYRSAKWFSKFNLEEERKAWSSMEVLMEKNGGQNGL